MPGETPKRLCLFSSPCFISSPQNNPDVLTQLSCGEAGSRWEPHCKKTKRPGDFLKIFHLHYQAILGCNKLGFTAGGPELMWISRGQALQVQGGAPLLAHPCPLPWPHSCPALRPELLRLHGCDTSPGPSGLRGMFETFLAQFYFLLKMLFTSIFILVLLGLHCYAGFSPAESRGYFLGAVPRLLSAVASLIVDYTL